MLAAFSGVPPGLLPPTRKPNAAGAEMKQAPKAWCSGEAWGATEGVSEDSLSGGSPGWEAWPRCPGQKPGGSRLQVCGFDQELPGVLCQNL